MGGRHPFIPRLHTLYFCTPLISAKVLIATGQPYETSILTEVVDLADESTPCKFLTEYPIEVYGASGGMIVFVAVFGLKLKVESDAKKMLQVW